MVDPRTLELVNNRLDETVREMQRAVFRTGYSTIIRESNDTSACITTADGEVIGQNFHHIVHLGVFSPSVDAVYRYFTIDEIYPGDVFIMNDPYISGVGHANDMIVLNPVFFEEEIVAFTCNIAHKPDLGGLVHGTSSGAAREIYHEGIQIPPVKISNNDKEDEQIINIIRNNSRLPDLTIGDLRGQIGCTKIGKQKLKGIFSAFGKETVCECFEQLLDSTEQRLLDFINDWASKEYENDLLLDIPKDNEIWSDDLDPDELLRYAVTVENTGGNIIFDFSETDEQSDLPINLRPQIVNAVCSYALIGLTDPSLLTNSGVMRIFDVITRKGSALNPERPAPVNQYSYGIEMLTRLVIRSLNEFVPDDSVADANGIIVITVGEEEMDSVQYEMIYSGFGGTTKGDGATGVSTHTTNCSNTPIEIVESEFPTHVKRYQVIPNSEGPGEFRGGFGIRREYLVQSDVQFTYRPGISNVFPPQGVEGGGAPDEAVVCQIKEADTDTERRLPTIADTQNLQEGAQIKLEVYGGAGYGDPLDRDDNAVLRDYLNGFITADRAEDVYGVSIDTDSDQINEVD